MMDLGLTKPSEILQRLCLRIRRERIVQQMTQSELAARAGISANTVSNLEAGRSVAFDSIVRVAMVLGRAKEIEALFVATPESLDELRQYERSETRSRVRRSAKNA